MTSLKSVRDVAFLRQACERAPQGRCPCLDAQFSNCQGAYNPWRASQEETVWYGDSAASDLAVFLTDAIKKHSSPSFSLPYSHFQTISVTPTSLEGRLELCWLQKDVAAKIGISFKSVSDWERGITSPSRRITKKIQEFLDYKPVPMLKKQPFHCQLCGISEISPERCLFEKICNSFTESKI